MSNILARSCVLVLLPEYLRRSTRLFLFGSISVSTVSLEPSPCVSALGSLRLARQGPAAELTDSTIHGDAVFFKLGPVCVVWNFKESWYKSWNVASDASQHQVC